MAPGRALRGKPLRLAVEVARVLRRGPPRVNRHTLTAGAYRHRLWLDENGARIHLMAGQLPRFPPTPSGAITDALLSRIVLKLHTSSRSYVAIDVYCCPLVL